MDNTESTDTIIEMLQQRLEQSGLSKSVTIELSGDDGMISLDLIRSIFPGQGQGGGALKLLLSLCDEYQIVIKLIPTPLCDECLEADELAPRLPNMSKEQLEEWYKRFGFEYGPDKTAEGISVMLRKPVHPQ